MQRKTINETLSAGRILCDVTETSSKSKESHTSLGRITLSAKILAKNIFKQSKTGLTRQAESLIVFNYQVLDFPTEDILVYVQRR